MKKNVITTIIAIMMIAVVALGAAGCQNNTATPAKPAVEETPAPVEETLGEIKLMNIADAVYGEDEPVIPVPANYTKLELEGIEFDVYAFTDSKGDVQYRAYGEQERLNGTEVVAVNRGFYPITVIEPVAMDESEYVEDNVNTDENVEGNVNAMTAIETAEPVAVEEPVVIAAPAYTYELAADAVMVDETLEDFGVCTPVAIPEGKTVAGWTAVEGKVGLLTMTTDHAVTAEEATKDQPEGTVIPLTIYAVYGDFEVTPKTDEMEAVRSTPAFYPANEDGTMIAGALDSGIVFDAMAVEEDSAVVEEPTDSKKPTETKKPTATKKPTESKPEPTKAPNKPAEPKPTTPPKTGHYEKKWVVDKAAWDEPIYEEYGVVICNGCGADITANQNQHTKAHALAGEPSNWHTETRKRLVNTIHHDEEGHYEEVWVED